MRIRIVSEGEGQSTKVVNADTGEVIEGVRSVEWTCFPGEAARAILEVLKAKADVVGEVDELRRVIPVEGDKPIPEVGGQ